MKELRKSLERKSHVWDFFGIASLVLADALGLDFLHVGALLRVIYIEKERKNLERKRRETDVKEIT